MTIVWKISTKSTGRMGWSRQSIHELQGPKEDYQFPCNN